MNEVIRRNSIFKFFYYGQQVQVIFENIPLYGSAVITNFVSFLLLNHRKVHKDICIKSNQTTHIRYWLRQSSPEWNCSMIVIFVWFSICICGKCSLLLWEYVSFKKCISSASLENHYRTEPNFWYKLLTIDVRSYLKWDIPRKGELLYNFLHILPLKWRI